MRAWNILICVGGLIAVVGCFPSGAPHKACANIYPKHGGIDTQLSNPPYSVSLSSTSYNPGDDITVTLSANPGQTFKGFIIIANRLTGDTEENVGRFHSLPATAKALFWYPQQDNYDNCITHNSPVEKTSVQVKWTSPVSVGDIMFRMTFVTSASIFYVDVRSQVVTALMSDPSPPFNSTVSTDFDTLVLAGECGNTKGCMLFPSYCGGDDCTYAVAYTTRPDGVLFEVKAKSVGYLTFALSEDKFMGDDLSVTCTQTEDGNFVSVQHGFNPAYFNDKHRILGLRDIQTKREDGFIYCRWLHPYSVSHTHLVTNADGTISKVMKNFDLNNPFHFFMAWGKLYAGSDVLGKHKEHPIVTGSQVKLSDRTVVRGGSLPIETKLHATFNILAWVLCVGIAAIVARHFRERFSNTRSGTADWFQIHRALNIICFLLAAAAFILIFVKLKKWTLYANNHAIIGSIVTGLVLVQFIAGLARPSPDSANRYGFNWFHRVTGKVTHILAGATFMLALYTDIMHAQLQRTLTIVFAVWIGIQVLWELVVFEVIKQTSSPKVTDIDDGLDKRTAVGRTFSVSDAKSGESNTQGLNVAFALYVVSIVALTVTSLTFLWLF